MTPYLYFLMRHFQARWFWAWASAIGAVGVVLCFLPLWNLLGYEFSAAVGLVGGVGAGCFGIQVVATARRQRRTWGVGVLFGTAWLLSVFSLIPPLLAISLNALRVRNCDFAEGFAFYLLIPGVSATYGAAGGVFFGLLGNAARRSLIGWIAWLVGSVLLAIQHVAFQPPKFVYHALIGFIPGPFLYDQEVTITTTFLLGRGIALLTAGGFLSVAWAFHSPYRQELTYRALFYGQPPRRWAGATAILCVGALGIVWANWGPLGIRPTRRDIQRVLSRRYETDHFILYCERGSPTDRNIVLIAADHEFQYAQLTRFFGFQVPRKIGSYLYSTPEDKRKWMGAKRVQMADPLNREIHLNASDFPHTVLKHELAHVFAGEFHPIMKLSPAIGLLEGVAVAAEWDDGRLTAHQWARAMLGLNLLPSVREVMSPMGFWSVSSSRAYTASGSFVRWLVEAYGMETITRVYPSGNFQKAYGKPLEELQAEWERFLATVPMLPADLKEASRRFTRPSVFETACAHEIANLEAAAWKRYGARDFIGARLLFERIARFEPGNPEHRWRLVQTDVAAENWEAARNGADILSQQPNASESLRLRCREVVADAEWRFGRPETAQWEWEFVRDAEYSPDMTRRALVKLAALEQDATVQRTIRNYLSEDQAQTQAYWLRELTVYAPNWGIGHYLLGRTLFQAQEWEATLQALRQADMLGLPNRNFEAESARIQGMALYRLGEWNLARSAFVRAETRSEREGERLQDREWQARCQWARATRRTPQR